jgi:hypothetical protein
VLAKVNVLWGQYSCCIIIVFVVAVCIVYVLAEVVSFIVVFSFNVL